MIITHTSPDFDAIAACWLLQRFGPGRGDRVEFRPANTPAAELAHANVVDMGGGCYDHHQLADPQATCAAKLVYKALAGNIHDMAQSAAGPAAYWQFDGLAPLIDLIWRGDTGRLTPTERDCGIHALLSSYKATSPGDQATLEYGYGILDALAARLGRQAEAAAQLAEKLVYRSKDGLFVAVDGGDRNVSNAAFAAGAAVVLFHSPLPETVSVGLARSPEFDGVNVGELCRRAEVGARTAVSWAGDDNIRLQTEAAAIAAELETWYRHGAGFFAGRGTAKAPDARPLAVPMARLAAVLDGAWIR